MEAEGTLFAIGDVPALLLYEQIKNGETRDTPRFSRPTNSKSATT